MFCAALLDAYPDLLPQVLETVDSLKMPVPVRIELKQQPGILNGKHFQVSPQKQPEEHSHTHTPFRDIRQLLESAPLGDGVRQRALAIFTLLALAEGQVHGVPADEVSFHEVGSWDSIADIVSAAALLDAIGVESSSTGPLPTGSGRIKTAHGLLPVPAPATAHLLVGLPLMDDGIPGERVTPTGAAILRSLHPEPRGLAQGILRTSGMGFGSRTLEGGVPNCLQLLCIETELPQSDGFPIEFDQVIALRFEIDDQTGEDLAVGLERLRGHPGVHSVTTLQGIGKLGRPTMNIEVLARLDASDTVTEACFRETTTIGLRWQPMRRTMLVRGQQQVDVNGRQLEVKRVLRPDGPDAKIESRDLAGIEGSARRRHLAADGVARTLRRET
jgi:uncharacterized protein (TIGR00299 family) protein